MKNIVLAALVPALLLGSFAEAELTEKDKKKYFDLRYLKEKNRTPANTEGEIEAYVLPQYQNSYAKRPDFARLEHERPLDKDFLRRIMPADVLAMDQEMADQLYARLTAGPIPNGAYDGQAKIQDGSAFKTTVKVFTREEQRSGFYGLLNRLGLRIVTADRISGILSALANSMWKGKIFYKDERVLRNVIPVSETAGGLLEFLVKGFNYRSLPVDAVNIQGRTFNAWKLFPARLYCGQSLMDSRRESIIIDYAYSDRLPGYKESIDFLASRHGLYVRDEIRMVRPGFYIGKAYINKMFFLTFTLYDPQVDARGTNAQDDAWANQECWTGTQRTALR